MRSIQDDEAIERKKIQEFPTLAQRMGLEEP
jgi:hypothetical protein